MFRKWWRGLGIRGDLIMSNNFRELVLKSCENKRDYSGKFTSKILKIKEDAERAFNTMIYHGDDMNYGASQELRFFLDKKGNIITRDNGKRIEELEVKARYLIRILISSLGEYYLFELNKRKKILWLDGYDYVKETPEKMIEVKNRITDYFEKLDFKSIPEDLLNQKVESKVRALDGKTATVLDIIFSEI